MKTTMKVTKDTTNLLKLRRRLQALQRQNVEWGFFEGVTYMDDERMWIPVARIAYMQNYGLGVPPRPFFSDQTDALQRYRTKLSKSVKPLLVNLFAGSVTNTRKPSHITALGNFLKEDLSKRIDDNKYEKNAPWWAAYKRATTGRGDPLVWTGTMRDSVNFRVK